MNLAMDIYNTSQTELPALSDAIVCDHDQLRFRADLLDAELLNSPSGMANATKIELINQLREQAPWLAPMVL